MSGPELVIEGKAFVKGELIDSEIGIDGGLITEVGRSVSGGDRRIRVGAGRIVLPGFVDPHVHFRDPGMTQKEDFTSGSLAALFGGVTCVFDMPNTIPPVCDPKSLGKKKTAIRGRSYVDYGLFTAVTEGFDASNEEGSIGFKLFMGSTTGRILLNDDDAIADAMSSICASGKVLSVHAEDDALITKEKENCTADHLSNRPSKAEFSAISRLSRYQGVKINICHNTDPESVRLASKAGFTTEVTMHHLLFDVDRNTDAEYKCNPPIRSAEVRDALFREFIAGRITMFGSDHAPHTVADKELPFNEAPGGIPGVETTMPLVMEMVRNGTIPLSLAVRMGAEAPSDRFGIQKGHIEEGYDADLCIFDMSKSRPVMLSEMHSKAGHTPYAGMSAVFPDTVIIRGNIQMEEGGLYGRRIGEDVCG